MSSYLVLGYKAYPRFSKDSYVLDVIRAILGRGQSGRLFHEIRTKRGLAYEVGVHHEASSDYGVFAVYLNSDKKNIPLSITLIMKEFFKLQVLKKKDLEEAKTFIEGEFYLQNEDNFQMADNLSFWEMIKDARNSTKYISEIKKITLKDIERVSLKLLNKNYTMALIEQK